MNADAESKILRVERSPQEYSGFWQPVLFQPELKSPQHFVVGVVTQSNGEARAMRLLASLRKLECVYGDRFNESQIALAFSWIRDALDGACKKRERVPNVSDISPHWQLGAPLFCSGETPEQAVNLIYDAIVPMDPGPNVVESSDRFRSRDIESIRSEMHRHLKSRLHDRFEHVIETRGVVEHKVQGSTHPFRVDVMTGDCIGAFCSAWYGTEASVEHNLLIPQRDIAYLSAHYRKNQRALFIARPLADPNIDDRQAGRIRDLIQLTWGMLTDSGWRVEVEEDLQLLSDHVTNFVSS